MQGQADSEGKPLYDDTTLTDEIKPLNLGFVENKIKERRSWLLTEIKLKNKKNMWEWKKETNKRETEWPLIQSSNGS